MVLTFLVYLLYGLGYLLLTLVIILAAVILIPYEYQFSGDNLEQPHLLGRISWLGGGIKINFRYDFHSQTTVTPILFGIRLRPHLFGSSRSGQPDSAFETDSPLETLSGIKPSIGTKISTKIRAKTVAEKTANTGPEPQLKQKKSNFRSYLKREILNNAVAAIVKIFRHSRPRKLIIDARVGFYDPMLTGFVYALNGVLYDFMNQYDIHIEPTFEEETVRGRFLIDGRIWLAYVIAVFLGFLITKSIRNIIFKQIKMKFKGGPHYVR